MTTATKILAGHAYAFANHANIPFVHSASERGLSPHSVAGLL
jgi:hypothetical protein